MHAVSGPMADDVVQRMGALEFRHVLDVGGASGTWTLALLRAVPAARGTIFDLPDAIRQARERIGGTPFAGRIEFAQGDFYRDELPAGADFAWVSAIIHQHARDDSRALFAKAYRALTPNGRIAIRDFVMDPDRIRPAAGALFAVNMLANTEHGNTFTFAEIAEDLQAVGFQDVELRIPSDGHELGRDGPPARVNPDCERHRSRIYRSRSRLILRISSGITSVLITLRVMFSLSRSERSTRNPEVILAQTLTVSDPSWGLELGFHLPAARSPSFQHLIPPYLPFPAIGVILRLMGNIPSLLPGRIP